MLNHIIIMGRLTRDPELRQAGGSAVASFTVAVSRDYKDKNTGETPTDFIEVVSWGARAEHVCRYFSKGAMVVVEGRLQIDVVEKNGAKNWYTKVNASQIHFGESRREADARRGNSGGYNGGGNSGGYGGGGNSGGYGGGGNSGGYDGGGNSGGYGGGGNSGGYGGGGNSGGYGGGGNSGGYDGGGNSGGYGGGDNSGGYGGGGNSGGYDAGGGSSAYSSQSNNAEFTTLTEEEEQNLPF